MTDLVNHQKSSVSVPSQDAKSSINRSPLSQEIPTHESRSTAKTHLQTRRLELSSRYRNHRSSVKLDSVTAVQQICSLLGFPLPTGWRAIFECYLLGIVYTSLSCPQYHVQEQSVLVNIKRRLRIIIPMLSFQIQTSNLPKSITLHPVVACENQVFTLSVRGEFVAVRTLFERSQASPFVVNQHGENLLHVRQIY
jgi:hypothetical protein